MPTDSNGVHSLPAGYLATTGQTIQASQHNPPLEDVSAALTARLPRNGAAPMTGALGITDGAVGAPALKFTNATTTGVYKTSTGWGATVSGSLVAEFNSSGFVLNKTAVFKDGGDVASAAALTLGDGNIFNITGTTAITSIGAKGIGTLAILRFADALTITHHATDLITTTGANIATRAGAWALIEEYAAGDWRMVFYQNPVLPAPPPAAAFKNLVIKVASNTTVTVTADYVTTTDGTDFKTTAVSSTINLGTTGADALDAGTVAIDTWYAIWVIAKADGTTKCLASTSASSPTMPSGYTFKARGGWVRTIHGSATLYGTWQLGRRVQYIVGLAQTGSTLPVIINATTGTAWTTQSISAFFPTTASIAGFVQSSSTQSSGNFTAIAPNGSYSAPGGVGTAGTPFYRQFNGASVGAYTSDQVWMMIESSNIYWQANTAFSLFAMGWEDNL